MDKVIKFIIDSTCDFPEDMLDEMEVDIIPARILLGDKEYYDGVDITLDELYRAMRAGVMPVTSQPNLMYIMNKFEAYAKEGQEFIYLAFAQEYSGTYGTAKMVISQLKEQYPNVKMEALDTKAGSVGIGLLLKALYDHAQVGMEYEELVKKAGYYNDRLIHLFTLNDLFWLNKGGRLSKGKALIGTIMNLKPILKLENGELDNIKSVRGRKKVLRELAEVAMEGMKSRDYEYVGIVYGETEEVAYSLEKILKEKHPERKYIISQVGIGLAAHLGMEGAGIIIM